MSTSASPVYRVTSDHWQDDILALEVEGEIDLHTAPQFADTLLSAVASSPTVVIDFTSTGFLDSSGANGIFRALRHAHERGTRLAIVSRDDSHITKALTILGLPAKLPVAGSREQVLLALTAQAAGAATA